MAFASWNMAESFETTICSLEERAVKAGSLRSLGMLPATRATSSTSSDESPKMSMPRIMSKVHRLCCRALTKLPQLCSAAASSSISRLGGSRPWTFLSLSNSFTAYSPTSLLWFMSQWKAPATVSAQPRAFSLRKADHSLSALGLSI